MCYARGDGRQAMNWQKAATRLAVGMAMAAVVAWCPKAAAQAQISYRVGTAEALRGQRANGVLEVPKGVDAGYGIPVIVVNGVMPGRVLALVAGAHGTEYASILALERVAAILDPMHLTGTVVILPLVNPASFEHMVPHVNPVDGKNMNRFYPGKADGTQTERAAYVMTKEVVERCDYLIDYHGGDLDESLRPYSYWGPTGHEEQDRISKEMVLAFGLNHIILWRDRPTDPAATRYLDNTASVKGKPAIVVEAGHAGTVESDDVNLLVTGTISTMRALKMLEGPPLPIENPVWLEKTETVASEKGGIFYPLVLRSVYVAEGEKLGYVTDYYGNIVSTARAPVAGVVLHICAVPTMKQGDTVAVIGVPAEKAP